MRYLAPGVAGTLALGAAWLLLSAGEAQSWLPPPERLAGLVAEQNRTADRTTKLRLAVQVKNHEGQVVARGEAYFDPNGRARLELEYADGHRELHERRGGASRIRPIGSESTPDEAPLGSGAFEATPLLLPPFGLLQASASQRVLGALRELGGDPTRVELGLERGRDCWVLGGRTLGNFDVNDRPALWIDLESKAPLRIDAGSGTRYRLGPPARFGSIELPSWYEVEGPAEVPLRVEIEALAAPNP